MLALAESVLTRYNRTGNWVYPLLLPLALIKPRRDRLDIRCRWRDTLDDCVPLWIQSVTHGASERAGWSPPAPPFQRPGLRPAPERQYRWAERVGARDHRGGMESGYVRHGSDRGALSSCRRGISQLAPVARSGIPRGARRLIRGIVGTPTSAIGGEAARSLRSDEKRMDGIFPERDRWVRSVPRHVGTGWALGRPGDARLLVACKCRMAGHRLGSLRAARPGGHSTPSVPAVRRGGQRWRPLDLRPIGSAVSIREPRQVPSPTQARLL